MTSPSGSDRAVRLAARLDAAAAALVDAIAGAEPDRWNRVPAAGTWSAGKDAEHVADAAAYHRWIVGFTIGELPASRRPRIERARLTTGLSPREAAELILRQSALGVTLVARLSDEQLDLTTRPPRARAATLATTIERVMIDHYDVHRRAIAAKLAAGC